MTLYSLLIAIHAGFGSVALATFWIAALARKGSPLHVRTGRIHLLTMTALMTLAVPMALMISASGKNPVFGIFLWYLLLITFTATWLGWRAIADRRDYARYTGPVYRVLMWLNLAGGLGMAATGLWLARQMQGVMIAYATIGIVIFFLMRRFAAQPPNEPRWWLRAHLRAMMGNGVAVHIAFLSIGLPRLLPMLSGPVFQHLAWLAPLAAATLAGVWLSRKHLRPAAQQ